MSPTLKWSADAARSASLPAALVALVLLTGWSPTIGSAGNGSIVEPARICGTNSSRSRRCNFGHRDCLAAGKGEAACNRALAICRSCIDVMVACQRQTALSCATCTQRYGDCMAPWVEIMSR